MSLTAQFRLDLGSEGDSEKQIGDEYVIEVKYFTQDTTLKAWEQNDDDVRGWTPRFTKTFFKSEYDDHQSVGREVYRSITSVESMKEQLDDYEDSVGYNPEIQKE